MDLPTSSAAGQLGGEIVVLMGPSCFCHANFDRFRFSHLMLTNSKSRFGHGEGFSGDISLSNCGRAEIDLYSFKRTSPALAPLGLETNFFWV